MTRNTTSRLTPLLKDGPALVDPQIVRFSPEFVFTHTKYFVVVCLVYVVFFRRVDVFIFFSCQKSVFVGGVQDTPNVACV